MHPEPRQKGNPDDTPNAVDGRGKDDTTHPRDKRPASPPLPSLLDTQASATEAFKDIISASLTRVPSGGVVTAPLAGLIWGDYDYTDPASRARFWDKARLEIQGLLDMKIEDNYFDSFMKQWGLIGQFFYNHVMILQYGGQVGSQQWQKDVSTSWVHANDHLEAAELTFMGMTFGSGGSWHHGTMFLMYAVVRASLYRDAVLHGLKDWGWSAEMHEKYSEEAKNNIAKYIRHTGDMIKLCEKELEPNAPTGFDITRTKVYNYWQPFRMRTIIGFDDYRVLLQYLDPFAFPRASGVPPFQDVPSPAFGSARHWDEAAVQREFPGGVGIAYSSPSRSFASLTVHTIQGVPSEVFVEYPQGQGPFVQPGGVRRTDKHSIIHNFGIIPNTTLKHIPLPDPGAHKAFNITKALVQVARDPVALTLYMDDGSTVEAWKSSGNLGGTGIYVQYEGRKLSTMNMWTLSPTDNWRLGCLILGFSKDRVEIANTVLRHLYITSIGDLPAALESRIEGDKRELMKEREAYWKELKKVSRKAERRD